MINLGQDSLELSTEELSNERRGEVEDEYPGNYPRKVTCRGYLGSSSYLLLVNVDLKAVQDVAINLVYSGLTSANRRGQTVEMNVTS